MSIEWCVGAFLFRHRIPLSPALNGRTASVAPAYSWHHLLETRHEGWGASCMNGPHHHSPLRLVRRGDTTSRTPLLNV